MNETAATYQSSVIEIHEQGQDSKIDWPCFLKRRAPLLKVNDDLPNYLLLPEVHLLLDSILDQKKHFLFNVLWHTGARISEALALTYDQFALDEEIPMIYLASAKKRGRPSTGRKAARGVPILDPVFLNECQQYLTTHKLTGKQTVFTLTRATADRWLRDAMKNSPLINEGVSCHTLRHSFAVNALLHFVPITVVRDWLGHSDLASTAIYTKVFSPDTAHFMQRVDF